MNLFYLDRDIKTNASFYCDQHVVKMPIEFGQMLSNVWWTVPLDLWPTHDIWFTTNLYRSSHTNHPMTKWVGTTVQNYRYTLDLAFALHDEHLKRFGTPSGAIPLLKTLRRYDPPIADDSGMTEVPRCFGFWKDIRTDDVIEDHREFYRQSKKSFARYQDSTFPYWF